MFRSFPGLLLLGAIAAGLLAADSPTQPAGYFNDFEKAAPGKPPPDLFVLDGEFTVKAEGDNHFLELAPDPVKNYGILFGPEAVTLADVGAKIYATSSGRRFPEFGIGCGDGGGYKLILVPAQSSLQLCRGDETVAQAPYDKWQTGQWLSFRLKVVPAPGGKWQMEGKVWPATAKEPESWSISYETAEAPSAGRASILASPYSGTPIRFDDLSAAGATDAKGG